jgi:hypothetical protein
MTTTDTADRYAVESYSAPTCDGGGTKYAVIDTTRTTAQGRIVWRNWGVDGLGGFLDTRDSEQATRWCRDLNDRQACLDLAHAEASETNNAMRTRFIAHVAAERALTVGTGRIDVTEAEIMAKAVELAHDEADKAECAARAELNLADFCSGHPSLNGDTEYCDGTCAQGRRDYAAELADLAVAKASY